MTKAMFGIAAALALVMTPAWAGDEKSDEKATRDTVASSERAGKSMTKVASHSARKSASERDAGSVAQAGTGNGKADSSDAEASHAERWLVEREGYRDGGY
jgi:hypothetical protein